MSYSEGGPDKPPGMSEGKLGEHVLALEGCVHMVFSGRVAISIGACCLDVQNVQETAGEQVDSTHKGENWKCLRKIWERGEESLESRCCRKERRGQRKKRNLLWRFSWRGR